MIIKGNIYIYIHTHTHTHIYIFFFPFVFFIFFVPCILIKLSNVNLQMHTFQINVLIELNLIEFKRLKSVHLLVHIT
jgi:hypothetical protein